MGTTEFQVYAEGVDPEKAFRNAIGEATAEYGNRPHTGSVAEKSEFIVVHADPVPYNKAEKIAMQALVSDERIQDKFGPAGAIAVATTGRTVEVSIPERPEGYANLTVAAEAAIADIRLPGEKYFGVAESQCTEYGDSHRVGAPSRIMSGHLRVVLTGGKETHTGWLFFGRASR